MELDGGQGHMPAVISVMSSPNSSAARYVPFRLDGRDCRFATGRCSQSTRLSFKLSIRCGPKRIKD